MKREFIDDDFEDFLKRSADSLRMKAPDRVWQNLSKDLGKRQRRRVLTGLSAFLLLTTAAAYYIVTNTQEQELAVQHGKQPSASQPLADTHTNAETKTSLKEAKVVFMQPKVQASGRAAGIVSKNENVSASLINGMDNKKPDNNLLVGEAASQDDFTPTVVDTYPTEEDQALTQKADAGQTLQKTTDVFPLTIESVTNAYKKKHIANRFETQLYFTPSSSYRKLTENKSYLRSLNPALVAAGSPALYSSVNNNVTHKPDVGFELGFATKYALSNRLKIRSGVQFNVNRYDVKAFSSSGSTATLWLNNGSGVDSLNTYTRYSNLAGYKSDWLQNLYFQLSVPVGVEYLLSNDDKVHFGIAATVQPTYVLGDRAYLITTDYKSYTEAPSLTRRWNVNTSLETFVGFKRWQFGPQVRYQLLSSFESKYPVKENLFDFGLKVGVKLGKQ